MTRYPTPLEQQYGAAGAELKQRVARLEAQVAHLTSGPVAVTSATHPAHPATGQQILETDTSLTAYWSGTAWVYPPQLIQNVTLTGSGASVTFSNIPAVFNSLRLEWRVHLSSGAITDLLMQVDGVTSSSYLWSKMESSSTTQANVHSGAAVAFMRIGLLGAGTAGYFGNGMLTIGGWSNANGDLSFSGTSAYFDSNTVDAIGTYGGLYAGGAPHSSLKIFPAASSLAAGSQFSLFGLG